MRRAVSVLLLTIVTACGGGMPTGPTPPYIITGVVNDAETGRGIVGARFTVLDGPNSGRTATTDATGWFTLTDMARGDVNVSATADGFQEAREGRFVDRSMEWHIGLDRLPRESD